MFKIIRQLQSTLDYNRATVQTNLQPYQILLEEINKVHLENISLNSLQKQAGELKRQALNRIAPEILIVKAFALVREVSWRLLGLRPFDVQILAGLAMHEGKIVEMLTGEGKTLAAVLPACLNALTGNGVHILTFNDYLAKRDAQWMGPVYEFMGLSVGSVQSEMEPIERKKAYLCDITYVTAKEAGFDHLRSFLCYDRTEFVQRPFNFAIIDEADSILVDEGRIPMVIAGSWSVDDPGISSLAGLVRKLRTGIDFVIDEYKRNINLTEEGVTLVEKELECGNLYAAENLTFLSMLNNALHAEFLLERDVDYIVRDGRIELVDEFTGRVVENRHWPDGLQEALEAKEGLRRRAGGKILGSITMRYFLNSYPKIAGMTGTAQAAADEFKEFYNLDVVVIPPNRPCIRIDEPDLIYTHRTAKFKALIQEITRVHESGRPILIGTGSVQESEHLAGLLAEAGVLYQLLNAKNDELEAEIIAKAGVLGAVTISTNMAGRGTDIRLGGADEKDRERVKELGGLYVIGINHFESSRIDNQLRGRAGRQGDPGVSRFFISLEDELIVRYGIKELIPEKYRNLQQEEPVQDPVVSREIMGAQRIIEAQNYEIRKNLWKYSWIVEKQRRIVQERRQNVLMNKEKLYLFQSTFPKRYRELANSLSEDTLYQAEKYITLYQIDNCWANFLEEVAQIREGIHLVHLSGKNPLHEFHRMVENAFRDLELRINREIIETLGGVEITANGINPEKEGLRGPSATWTYLTTDTPFEK